MTRITPKTVFTTFISAIAILALPFSTLAAQPQSSPLLTSTKVTIGDETRTMHVKQSPNDPNTLDLTLDQKILKKSCARVVNTNNNEIPLLIQVTKLVNVTGASVKSGDNLKEDDVIAKKVVALTYTCPTKTVSTQTTTTSPSNTQPSTNSSTNTQPTDTSSLNNGTPTTGTPTTDNTTGGSTTSATTTTPNQPLDVQITVEKQVKTTQPTTPNQENTTQPTKST